MGHCNAPPVRALGASRRLELAGSPGRASARRSRHLVGRDRAPSRARCGAQPNTGTRTRARGKCLRRPDPARRADRGPRSARALARQHAGVQRDAAPRQSRLTPPASASQLAIPSAGHIRGSVGTTTRALCSCPTSLHWRCIGYSTQSKPRSSPTITRSGTTYPRAHHHRGYTRTATGGRGDPPSARKP